MSLITLGPPDRDAIDAASSHVRAIFSGKLLLSALIIPIAIAALFELPHIFDHAESQFKATPILAILTLGSFYLVVGLFGLKVFAVYFPVFGPVCGAPIHSKLWHSTMFAVGLLLDAMVLTPRIFLGSAMDSLSQPQPTTAPNALFSKHTNTLLLILIVPFAAITYLAWRPFYTNFIAQSRAEYESKHYFNLTADELNSWYEFDDQIRRASDAQTFEEALNHVYGLRRVVAYLPYREEQHRRMANDRLDWAESHLNTSLGTKRTHPDLWRPEFRNIIAGVSRHIPQRAEIPGPIIDPMPSSKNFTYATPTESLLPPAQDYLAANSNSVRSEATEVPFQAESAPPASRTRRRLEPTPAPATDIPPSTPTPLPQESSESPPQQVPQPSHSITKQTKQPTTPAASPEQLPADVPPNPFQKGTVWTGVSLQVSDGGINPQDNDGAQIGLELTIKQYDGEQFEGTVRCPWATTAQGRRVNWGATASARGTYRNGEITIKTTPLHVPAGTVLLPGIWTGTVSDGVFSGEFRGDNDSFSEITLRRRGATNRRSK